MQHLLMIQYWIQSNVFDNNEQDKMFVLIVLAFILVSLLVLRDFLVYLSAVKLVDGMFLFFLRILKPSKMLIV